jgi:hypothetical protein
MNLKKCLNLPINTSHEVINKIYGDINTCNDKDINKIVHLSACHENGTPPDKVKLLLNINTRIN